MKYPTLSEIEKASRLELCRWHRFLRSPENEDEVIINNVMFKKWQEAGGFTPEISKQIGWTPIN